MASLVNKTLEVEKDNTSFPPPFLTILQKKNEKESARTSYSTTYSRLSHSHTVVIRKHSRGLNRKLTTYKAFSFRCMGTAMRAYKDDIDLNFKKEIETVRSLP